MLTPRRHLHLTRWNRRAAFLLLLAYLAWRLPAVIRVLRDWRAGRAN